MRDTGADLPRAIGYLVPEFPQQTHAFFWREILALEEAGVTVTCFSTRRPAAEACPHPFRAAARDRTRYLFPPHGRGAAYLAARPTAAARAVNYVRGLPDASGRQRLRLLGLIPCAADLVATCRAQGIEHVHIQSCADAAHLGAMAAVIGNLDYSLTLHGDLAVYGRDHASKMRRARFVRAVTPALTDQVRGVSPHTPTPMIWMGVDNDRFHPAPTRPDRPFTVVSVARLGFVKGHRFLLRALAQLARQGVDIHCRIAGEGPERAAIEAEIRDLDLSHRVEMLGAIGEEQVLALLRSADALALTSIGEGEAAPVAVMEAMACGLPVIASVIGGTPDMIRDGHDGFLVPQEDVDAIAGALRRLHDDPGLRARVGINARATAVERFDHRASAMQLIDQIARTRRMDLKG